MPPMKSFSLVPALLLLACASAFAADKVVKPVAYRVQLDVVNDDFDGKLCWFHPRAGAIPGPMPTVVLTMQRWNVARSDVFYPIASLVSPDLGRRSEEHTSELQSPYVISYAVFC